MKRYINGKTDLYAKEPIMAMATINPKLCQQKSIRVEVVQGGEGNKSHVHVYWNDGQVSYISLTSPTYAEHHHDNMGVPLTRKTRKEFVEIMSAIWNKYAIELYVLDDNGNPTEDTYFERSTGYEAAVQIWVDTYGDDPELKYEKNGRPIMPDYSKIPLEFKKQN